MPNPVIIRPNPDSRRQKQEQELCGTMKQEIYNPLQRYLGTVILCIFLAHIFSGLCTSVHLYLVLLLL